MLEEHRNDPRLARRFDAIARARDAERADELVGRAENGGGPSTVTYNTYVTKQGTLVVDIADAKNKQLLWRGSATDTISDNSNKNIKTLDNAVNKLFKSALNFGRLTN